MGALLVINFGIVVIFVLVFVFFYIKDGEVQKRLLRYEKSLDDLNKEIFKIQKFLKSNEIENGYSEESYKQLKLDLRNTIDDVYAIIEKDREYVDNKLLIIEDKIKEASHFSGSLGNVDDRKIISMFKDGWSIESIAKELMITKSEVEFTLKLANLN
ncbi:hypothetical protein [Helicobacter sp. MIT 99-5507]|uniref:hypothetical protein n=1 Tax=Helicobacter sp. MIT 99-5507 TaxID=152489 RepID=UPI000E1E4E8E|nr:hypothetical protein [Helicobacter sp. MIT 99-5507]RDU56643.1 hypothetical protein CQA42_07455 [Helicobacter sp. MIT 99-5507]